MEIKGYTLLGTTTATQYDGKVYYFRNNKTGARICYCDCPDKERRVQITFKTPITNSHGMAHVLEHSIMAQSQKYPVKNPYLEMDSRSVNTEINAATTIDHTYFYGASNVEKDLFNLTQVLFNCVFFPAIVKDKRIFLQEGFRKEIDASGHLSFNGIVYNEMMEDFLKPDYYLSKKLISCVLPHSMYELNFGGDPLEIPKLTYEEVISFYHRYYHPSKAFIHFYGHMDIEKILLWMDENVFSSFEKEPTEVEYPIFPLEKNKSMETTYPVKPGDKDACFAIAFEDDMIQSIKDTLLFDEMFYTFLTTSTSPLYHLFIDGGVAKSLSFWDCGGKQSFGYLLFKGCTQDSKEKVLSLWKDFVLQVKEHGFPHDQLKANIKYHKFLSLMKKNDNPYGHGEDFTTESLDDWLYKEEDYYEDYDLIKLYDEMYENIDNNIFESMFLKFFGKEDSYYTLFLKPDDHFLSMIEEEKDKLLKDTEDSLTKEEKETIQKESKELKAYLKVTSTKEELDTLPRLQLKDVNNLQFQKGIAVQKGQDYFYFQPSYGVSILVMMFDDTDFSKEEIQYEALLDSTITLFDKERHTRQEILQQSKLHLGDVNSFVSSYDFADNTHRESHAYQITSYPEEFKNGLPIAREMLCENKFDDNILKQRLDIFVNLFQRRLPTYALSMTRYAASSTYNESMRRSSLRTGFDAILFFKDLRDHYEERQVVPHLQNLIKRLITSKRLHFFYIGDEKDVDTVMKEANKFRDSLPVDSTYQDLPLKVSNAQRKIAYTSDFSVSSIALATDLGSLNYDQFSTLYLASNYVSQNFLAQKLRIQGGAYSWGMEPSLRGNLYLYSGQNPHLKESLEIFQEIPDFLRSNPIDEELLDELKIKAVAGLDDNSSLFERGDRALRRLFCQYGDDPNVKQRDSLLKVTVQDIMNTADLLEKVLPKASLCVAGPEPVIEENKSNFAKIVRIL